MERAEDADRRRLSDADVQEMREGVRARFSSLARRPGISLEEKSPFGLVALLCSSALAPIVVAAVGAPLGVVAAANVLGSVGANILSETVGEAVRSLGRRADGCEQGRDAVDAQLKDRLEAKLRSGDSSSVALRAEAVRLLSEIGAPEVALEAAFESSNSVMSGQIVDAFKTLAADSAEFRVLLSDTSRVLASLQERLQGDALLQRAGLEVSKQTLTELRMLRDDVLEAQWWVANSDEGTVAAGATRSWWAGECPYRGLTPFREDQAEVFFGRQRVTAELVGKVGERLGRPSLVVVTGASGAGKSSLLHAGLLPALRRGMLSVPGSSSWPRVVMTPTATPVDELAMHLSLLCDIDIASLRERILEHPEDTHLLLRNVALAYAKRTAATEPAGGSSARSMGANGAEVRLLIVIDQFEQVFTLREVPDGKPAQADAFMTALVAACSACTGPTDQPAAMVVLGLRGDYWDQCAAHPQLTRLLQDSQYVVGPMTSSELRQTITGPANAAGLTLDVGLTNEILDDLRSQSYTGEVEVSALPLLSQAMLITWENRVGDRLSRDSYAASGGVRHAVAASADAVYAELSPTQQSLARDLFVRLTVVTRENAAFARRRMDIDSLQGTYDKADHDDLTAMIEAFTHKRLLVRDGSGIQISHDILLVAWPTLRTWLRDDREVLTLYSHLVDRARMWDHENREPSYLYRGAELSSAQALVTTLTNHPGRFPELGHAEAEFLETSKSSARRRQRRTRLVRATLAVLSAISVLTAAVALQSARSARSSARTADHQHDVALSRQLIAQSRAVRTSDPHASLSLALLSWAKEQSPEARHAMLDAIARPGRDILARSSKVNDMAFSPTEDLVAAAGDDGGVHLWDATTHIETGPALTGHQGAVRAVAFAADGKTLVTADDEGTIRIWDVPAREQTDLIETGVGPITALALSPDRRTIAANGHGNAIQLWDLVSRGRKLDLAGHTRGVTDLEFSPDGKRLASISTTDGDGTVRLWDPGTGKAVGLPLAPYGLASNGAVAFVNDGSTIAVGLTNGSIHFYDVRTFTPWGDPITAYEGNVAIRELTTSPDGTTLASAGDDPEIKLWDVHLRQRIGSTLVGHSGTVTSLAFSGNGSLLASSGADQGFRLWTVDHGLTPADPDAIPKLDEPPHGYSPSPSGTIAEDVSGSIEVRDISDPDQPKLLRRIRYSGGLAGSVAVSADGHLVAASVLDIDTEHAELWVWSVDDGQAVRRQSTGQQGFTFYDLAFTADDEQIAVTSETGLLLWDIRTGQLSRHHADGTGGNDDDGPFYYEIYPTADDDQVLVETAAGLLLWNVRTDQFRQPWSRSEDPPANVRLGALDAGGTKAVLVDDEGSAIVFDLVAGEEIGQGSQSRGASGTDVTYGAGYFAIDDDRIVIETGTDVLLWNVRTDQITWPWPDDENRSATVRLTALDANWTKALLVDAEGSAIVYDLVAGTQTGPALEGSLGGIEEILGGYQHQVEFTPDETLLVDLSTDGMKMWELSSGDMLALPAELESFPASAFAASDDGTALVTGYEDEQAISAGEPSPGVVLRLDLATRQLLGEPNFVPAGPPENVTIDGSLATILTLDQVLLHLDLGVPSNGELKEAACASIGDRWLDQDEWHKYVGDEPMHNPCAESDRRS